MNCPKCNHQNPDDAKICKVCGCELTTSNEIQSQAKISKMAVFSLILSIPTIYLSIFTGIPAILYGYKSITKIRKSDRKLKGKTYARVAIIVSLVLLGLNLVLFKDAAPINDDYTIDYFGTSDIFSQQSYIILHSLIDTDEKVQGAPAIGLSENDLQEITKIRNILKEKNYEKMLEQIQANKNIIMSIWQNAQKGIKIFEQLDRFSIICDFTKLNLGDQPKYIKNYKNIIFVYQIYIYLQVSEGNYDEATQKLFLLDSINKKLSCNSRPVVAKLVNLAAFSTEIQIMNFIINNADTPDETLGLLKENIDSFDEENISLKNSIIFEYLTCKNSLKKIRQLPLLKYNSTLKLRRNISEKWLALDENRKPSESLKVWPYYYPNISFMTDEKEELFGYFKLTWYYKLYNPCGSFIEWVMRCNWEKVILIKKRFEIHSDMLKVVLNLRLGQVVDLKVLDYDDEYTIDIENKFISYTFNAQKVNISHEFSDSVSEDIEIKLLINPEVLGLTESYGK